jgi:hypothetical protein
VIPAGTIGAVKRSRESLREAGRVLTMPTPVAVEATVPRFETAIAAVGELAAALRSGAALDRAEALAAVNDLREELERAQALLDYAATYHAAWARILCSMASTYTPSGSAPLPEPPRRISVTG